MSDLQRDVEIVRALLDAMFLSRGEPVPAAFERIAAALNAQAGVVEALREARIAELEAERDGLRNAARIQARVVADLEAECDAARADAERNRVNAERYEWLRSRVPGSTYRIMGVIYSEGGEGVDAAIDAARGAE